MVEFRNVSVTYSTGVDALNNVSLKINDGDFAFVVGPSGAGKSTMIKLILREIKPSQGVVSVNGFDLRKLKKRDVPYLRRTIGFVFQDFRLIPTMTVYENVAFVLRVIDAPLKYIKKRVKFVISLVGLQKKADAFPDELSGGEKQRCAIARALVNDPDLIIADEPTGNIDPELSYEIVELLKEINDRGTTIMMVTHEHDLVRHFGGRIINLNKGKVTFDKVMDSELAKELAAEIAENDKPSQGGNGVIKEDSNGKQDAYYGEPIYSDEQFDTYYDDVYDEANTSYSPRSKDRPKVKVRTKSSGGRSIGSVRDGSSRDGIAGKADKSANIDKGGKVQ